MKMLMICALVSAVTAAAQPTPGISRDAGGATPAVAPVPPAPVIDRGAPEDKADPGYGLYREGYSLILEEKWDAARKKFAELTTKYPKSEYIDDAQYWTAYSYRYSDRKKAIAAYEKFIEANSGSSYYDDALADLGNLQAQAHPGAWSYSGKTPRPRVNVSVHSTGIPTPVSPAIAPQFRAMERQMRRQMRTLTRVGLEHMAPTAVFAAPPDEDLDPGTRLKMDALYALGETNEDEKSFVILKDVATDMQQPRPLREAAMDALTSFSKHDVLAVFAEIAKKDTSREIQGYAIDFIGEHGTDKNQRVAVLSDLYRSLPGGRTDQRQGIIYTIADVGNDRAVDFLKGVALTDENYELRRDAVSYLGSIGGEKARSALHEILKGK